MDFGSLSRIILEKVLLYTWKCLLVIELVPKLQSVGCENGLPYYKNHPQTFRKMHMIAKVNFIFQMLVFKSQKYTDLWEF